MEDEISEYDSDDPIVIITEITTESKNNDNLDFFEDKCRVSSSKSKRVIHSNSDIFFD